MKRVFVDTSFFKALIDEKDEFHPRAIIILKNLEDRSYSLLTTNYILDETFTLLRARCGLGKAADFRKMVLESALLLKVYRINVADEAAAWDWFLKEWHNLSFTDSVSFAVMKRLSVGEAATFDEHFKKAGFTIAA